MGLESFALKGKHVVIVGASSGIGGETARQCASVGATVSICARREDRLKEVLASLGGERPHRYAVLDAGQSERIEPCFDELARANGPIDGLVYAAGTGPVWPLPTITAEKIQSLFSVNVAGAILATKAAVKRVPKSGGSIVWVSSISARRAGGAAKTVYAATKGAMDSGTMALAYELARKKIRVNSIAPGAVETEMWKFDVVEREQTQKIFDAHPLGVGQPLDVALACVYLISDAARWITGTVLTIDGGYSIG
jgi:NAD(P)-dependent dehydrogenase (short-subunit alcohol dehydrogenase family)